MTLIVDQLESYDKSNLEVIRIEFAKLQKKLEDCQKLEESALSPEIGNEMHCTNILLIQHLKRQFHVIYWDLFSGI